jgi:hypothetical protein
VRNSRKEMGGARSTHGIDIDIYIYENLYKILFVKPEGKRSLERPRSTLEKILK